MSYVPVVALREPSRTPRVRQGVIPAVYPLPITTCTKTGLSMSNLGNSRWVSSVNFLFKPRPLFECFLLETATMETNPFVKEISSIFMTHILSFYDSQLLFPKLYTYSVYVCVFLFLHNGFCKTAQTSKSSYAFP